MLRARPGNYRPTDFAPGGRPDLRFYWEYYQYETVIWDDAPELVGLMLPKGVQNGAGQTVIEASEVKPKNLLKDASAWYVEAMTATQPILSGAMYAEERKEDLQRVILEMVRIAAVVGHGAVYVANNEIHVLSGTNLVPMVLSGNPIPYGWIMYWPYYLRPAGDRVSHHITIPNRIKIKRYIPDVMDETGTYYFHGGVIAGEATGDEVQDPEDMPIQSMTVFGVDEGFYPEGLKYATEIARLDAVIRELATTFAIPVPIISTMVGLMDTQGQLVDHRGNVIRAAAQRGLQSVRETEPTLQFINAITPIQDLAEERLEWMKRFHKVTRIPMEITENRDDAMSGVSRALMSRPAVDWIESTQKQIGIALDNCIAAITGQAPGRLEVEWGRNPFDTLAERRMIATEGYGAGWMTLNEARHAVDLDPLPGGDTINGLESDNSERAGDDSGADSDGNSGSPAAGGSPASGAPGGADA